METILIPVDFSKSSNNAAEYGILLGKQINAKLILFHVFEIPVINTDDPIIMAPQEELEEDFFLQMKEYETEMRSKYSLSNEVEFITQPGFLVDEIKATYLAKNVDLIIMGISEASALSELLVGSVSIDVIKNSNCPIIIVPPGVSYKPLSTIVFAYDIKKLSNKGTLKQIKKFVLLFKSTLKIIAVVESLNDTDFEKNELNEKYSQLFEGINYSIDFRKSDDLTIAINDFTEITHGDLLIMVSKTHSFFSKLFHKSNVKKMAFHSHSPLLVIHE